MILQSGKNKRKFRIDYNSYMFICHLLNDAEFDSSAEALMYKTTLEKVDCLTIAHNLDQCIKLNIWEKTCEDGSVLPIINPNEKQIGSNYLVNPLSNEKRYLLNKLCEFTKENSPISIES